MPVGLEPTMKVLQTSPLAPWVRHHNHTVQTEQKVPTGFEPVHKGFAGLCLTTWLRHPKPPRRTGDNEAIVPCSIKIGNPFEQKYAPDYGGYCVSPQKVTVGSLGSFAPVVLCAG